MTTDSRSLYAALLGLSGPWTIEDVEMKLESGEVHIRVALPKGERWVCPECKAAAPIHDHQDRQWRHLDTCQFKTVVHARVPRLNCPTHGIRPRVVADGHARRNFSRRRQPCADRSRLPHRGAPAPGGARETTAVSEPVRTTRLVHPPWSRP